VGAVTREELLARHPVPAPQTLADLDPLERVWTEHVDFAAVAHRKAADRTAVCGARLLEWPALAGDLAVLHGGLCQAGCWTTETPTGTAPAGRKGK
jgi:hypothetical protein